MQQSNDGVISIIDLVLPFDSSRSPRVIGLLLDLTMHYFKCMLFATLPFGEVNDQEESRLCVA